MRKLFDDYETQFSHDAHDVHDVPTLSRLLLTIYPFNKTNNNVLYDYEINDFITIYGINGTYSVFTNEDLIWFKDSAESIYIWSRVDDTLMFIGKDIREALVNYLFHEDNLFYVDPATIILFVYIRVFFFKLFISGMFLFSNVIFLLISID
jgi:hypothetical protein